VRLVLDARDQDGGRREACSRIGQQLGSWRTRCAAGSSGPRSIRVSGPGRRRNATRLAKLERENRAAEGERDLKSAAAFFAAELDRPSSR